MSINAALVDSTEPNHLTAPGKIPKPEISDDEILIKAVAFAANPTDWKHIAFGLGKKGDIVGSDASGIVEEVGKNVTGFAKGDIVSTFLRGSYTTERGAFAEYVRAYPVSTIKYDQLELKALTPGSDHPSGPIKTFEGAASITLGLVTVTLSFAHGLKIQPGSGKTILIWSGATATGLLAIQVAKLVFGLNVITTASPKHHDWLKSLGADAVFDYHDKNVVSDIQNYAKGSIAYALDTISDVSTFQALYDATDGSDFVAFDNLLGLERSSITEKPGRKVSFGRTLAYLVFKKNINLRGDYIYTPDILSDYEALWPKVLEIVPKLQHSKLKVLEPGFSTPAQALELLRQNKVSGEKVVWRAK